MQQLSTSLLFLVLILIPLYVFAEQTSFNVWQNRLAVPEIEMEINKHTPLYTAGTFLPADIKEDLELTPADGPILLTQPTRVPAGKSLTIQAGTLIFAHEFSQLIIEGTLIVNGTEEQKVVFASNELNPLNQTWGGIAAVDKGIININDAVIQDASPGISCLDKSQVELANLKILRGSMGIFQESPACLIRDSFINGSREGIVAVNTEPQLIETKIVAAQETVKIFKDK